MMEILNGYHYNTKAFLGSRDPFTRTFCNYDKAPHKFRVDILLSKINLVGMA